jgi:hypothetical protein
MWALQLNPMTANAEQIVPVAVAETEQDILALLERETVEPYTDGQWRKAFRQGGILEWFNPPFPGGEVWTGVPAVVDIGTEAEWVNDAIDVAKRRWQDLMTQVSRV